MMERAWETIMETRRFVIMAMEENLRLRDEMLFNYGRLKEALHRLNRLAGAPENSFTLSVDPEHSGESQVPVPSENGACIDALSAQAHEHECEQAAAALINERRVERDVRHAEGNNDDRVAARHERQTKGARK